MFNVPVIILKNLIILPKQEIKRVLNNLISEKTIKEASLKYKGEVLVISPIDAKEEEPSVDDLPKVGVIARIKSKLAIDKGIVVNLQGIKRVAVNRFFSSNEDILYKPYKIQENNTLLISEKQEKIFLPYTLSDLSKYTIDTEKSLEDIVRENFIIPLHTFRNPTISRFKETYNLARNKSNYSLFKSFNFAVEVMFKRNLNPAIIVACKNIDELKDYLNCLKEQKLDAFKAFNIKYEMNPMKI